MKRADLVLLDEPLANLDYKLREELREELPRDLRGLGRHLRLCHHRTTEALLLGGNTATLFQGRVHAIRSDAAGLSPAADLITAAVFSDPPLNMLDGV